MDKPLRAADGPFAVEVEAGETYWWCACGRSANQPFCDGSHKGSAFHPVKFVAANTELLFLCGCKTTGSPPLCDGSHKNPPD